MNNKLSTTVNYVILWTVIAALVFLIVTSIIVRDYEFIIKSPGLFIIEILFFSVIPALIIVFIMARTRNMPVKDTLGWLIAMIFKFSIFHVLFQLSGVYTVLFNPKV